CGSIARARASDPLLLTAGQLVRVVAGGSAAAIRDSIPPPWATEVTFEKSLPPLLPPLEPLEQPTASTAWTRGDAQERRPAGTGG
ncbi:MAG TPA: hypothetical protein VFW16_11165, partial [Streptosporangiaceae bacterium]|nr:hypothetical protein [Streptosporangiaceae bacterium]